MVADLKPDTLKAQLERELPGAAVVVESNALLIQPKDLPAVGKYLRDHATLKLDFLSHVTGVDYLKEGYLEAVYYLYSVANKHGPVVLRVRVPRDNPKLPSVVLIWRGAEFQEREAYDLYGLQFEGHPDLRRILMWDEFQGHPMRKDYVQEDQDILEDAQSG